MQFDCLRIQKLLRSQQVQVVGEKAVNLKAKFDVKNIFLLFGKNLVRINNAKSVCGSVKNIIDLRKISVRRNIRL